MLTIFFVIFPANNYNLHIMGLREKIKSLSARKALTITYVAEELTIRRGRRMTVTNFSKRLKNETLNYKELEIVADIIGYDIKFIERQ